MQRNVFVPLSGEAIAALTELARREYRDPKAQAAILIVDGLRRSGLRIEPVVPRPATLASER
jgi:hypothetical protein